MTSITAFDVAREIRGRVPGIPTTSVQKLLFEAQGLHLAWFGEPLFNERIEAWEFGPVVRDLWVAEKYGNTPPPANEVTGTASSVVDYVAVTWGDATASQMVELTHRQRPWVDAWAAGPNTEITSEEIARYFIEAHDPDRALIQAARDQPEFGTWVEGRIAEVRAEGAVEDDVEILVARLTSGS